ADQRGFAASTGTDDGDYLPFRDIHGNVEEGLFFPVPEAEMVYFKDGGLCQNLRMDFAFKRFTSGDRCQSRRALQQRFFEGKQFSVTARSYLGVGGLNFYGRA